MNRNLVGSIYGRFSINVAHFVPIHLQTSFGKAVSEESKKISQSETRIACGGHVC
jgi:hypothetical protein